MNTLNDIFRIVFDDPLLNITPATAIADIPNWDSIAQVRLVLAIEEEFGIEFNIEEVSAFKRAGDFMRALEARRVAV